MTNDKKTSGIIIDPGCSNNCVFCGHINKKPDQEIRKQEIGIAKDLINYRKQGYSKIEISGGDPIEYDKIVSLVRYIKKIGFNDILLNTHGKMLSDQSLAKELVSSGITLFRIPIYGSKAKIHDSVTQAEGSFDETIEGIKNITKINLSARLMLHTLVLQQNKEDIFNIFKLALKLKMNHFTISVACVADNDYSYYVPYKDLKPYLKDLIKYIFDNDIKNVNFSDIPHCVFGFDKFSCGCDWVFLF